MVIKSSALKILYALMAVLFIWLFMVFSPYDDIRVRELLGRGGAIAEVR
ncbi:MAG: hypothetical protein U0411_09555 [Thermodesulfovibrionales bacterium]